MDLFGLFMCGNVNNCTPKSGIDQEYVCKKTDRKSTKLTKINIYTMQWFADTFIYYVSLVKNFLIKKMEWTKSKNLCSFFQAVRVFIILLRCAKTAIYCALYNLKHFTAPTGKNAKFRFVYSQIHMNER